MLRFIETWNDVLFPGFTVTVAGGAGIILGWRRAGRQREIVILYGLIAMLACWMSFGPNAGLYSVMYRLVPLFAWLHAPARFGVLVVLALSVLGGIAVREWLARVRRPILLAGALALVATAMIRTPLRFREIAPVSPAHRLLSTLPVGPVVELPFFSHRWDLHGHTRYMLSSTAHWMPLLNGYSDHIPADFLERARALSTFPSRRSFRVLAAARARYAVIHMGRGDESAPVTARLRKFAPYLKPLHTDGDTHLYEIVAFPPEKIAGESSR